MLGLESLADAARAFDLQQQERVDPRPPLAAAVIVPEPDRPNAGNWQQRLAAAPSLTAFCAAEGLRLRLSSSSTGFAGVTKARQRFRAAASTRPFVNLGTFDTAEEAAVAVAFHFKRRGALPATTWRPTEVDGLKLHMSEANKTGYRGVRVRWNRYQALVRAGRKDKNLGSFSTAVEAAIAYAKAVQDGATDVDDLEASVVEPEASVLVGTGAGTSATNGAGATVATVATTGAHGEQRVGNPAHAPGVGWPGAPPEPRAAVTVVTADPPPHGNADSPAA